MATFTKTAILLALALTAGSVFAAAKPTTQTITTLGGKFNFTLPKAYVADTLPVDKAQDGTGVTQGTMYANQTSKSVVIVAETVRNDGIDVQDNDAQFLDGAVAGFVKDQSAALPDFKKLSEKNSPSRASACARSTAPPPRAAARRLTPRSLAVQAITCW